jgi:hypothetical protein
MGKTPQEVQELPQQRVRNELGPLGDNHLFITQQATRVDVILGVHPEKAATMPGLVSVGDYQSTAASFVRLVEKWLQVAPSLGRLAYAPIAFTRVNTIEEGYGKLRQLLPRLPLDEGIRNILWQANRPRKSNVVKDLTISRLTKWHLLTKQKIQLIQDAGRTLATNEQQALHHVRVELDIFTEPFMPIPAESVGPLLKELVDAANEILASGDVP